MYKTSKHHSEKIYITETAHTLRSLDTPYKYWRGIQNIILAK